MKWVRPLAADVEDTADVLGAKAHGLVTLRRLGLPVPAGFVVTTGACQAFLREGRLPDGLDAELAAAVGELETVTGRRFGGDRLPLAVSVRSGASVSMPGMMNTVLNLGLTTEATAGLGEPGFARDSRSRLLSSFASALADAGENTAIPDDATAQLRLAVETVFSSWNTPRARTYREINGVPHDLGTAVIVQAMVFGNRDDHSGTGVAFSRDPNTGENVPFGEVLLGHQGEDVVSGRSLTLPLRELGSREPAVWGALTEALSRVEKHYRDACYVEFTFEAGKLWLLQVRAGGFGGAAAVRVATDLADEHLITRHEALLRVSPRQLAHVRTPRIAAAAHADVLAKGVGACPGVATGRVAVTTGAVVRMAADGPVILVRPETSPHDMRGLAAAAGIVTARGGPASHAAVVARAMGKPAVVGIGALTIDTDEATISVGGRIISEGTVIAIDGTSGEVLLGTPHVVTNGSDEHLRRLLAWADEAADDHGERDEVQRLDAAHIALRRTTAR